MLERNAAGKIDRDVLRRAIAEALGWRVGENPEWNVEFERSIALYDPAGIIQWETHDEDKAWERTPDYFADLNAVAPLLWDLPVGVYFKIRRSYVHVLMGPFYGQEIVVNFDGIYELALAICCAWWQWRTGEALTVEEIEP